MKKRTKLNLVQACRAAAILFVLFGHGSTLFYKSFSYDWFNFGLIRRTGGVDFFFVVSGFMLYYLYHKNIGQKKKAWGFLKKRALRIYPLYWFFLGTSLAVFSVFPQLAGGYELSLTNVLKSIALFPTHTSVLAVTWSLSHVMLFYLVFGLFIYKGRLVGWGIFMWALFILAFPLFSDKALFLLSFNNFELLAGVMAAFLVLNVQIKKPKLLVWAGIAGYLAVWMNFTAIGVENCFYFYCIFAFLIMTGIAAIDLNQEVKVSKFVSFLGDASYSIYLAHGQFLHLFILVVQITKLNSFIGNFLTFSLVLLMTAAASCLVHIFIEKPLLSLTKRLSVKPVIQSKKALVSQERNE